MAGGEDVQTTRDVGAASVASRLVDILFVHALRGWLDLSEVQPCWIAALRDPLAGRVLRLIHGEPSRAWTLDDLARQASSSRSVLARRFLQSIGEPPMVYLTRFRMQDAASLLRDPERSLAAVAAEVGYASEFSFSRAFRRWAGISPGRFRLTGTRPSSPHA